MGIISIIWFIIGCIGFIYWWTKDCDLTTTEIPLIIVISTLGIFSWYVGWLIHGKPIKPKTLIKKENKI